MCSALGSAVKGFNTDLPQTVYYLAELKRIYNCGFLSTLTTQVNTVFGEVKSFTSIHDIYYLFLLISNAKTYNIDANKDVLKHI
jgi:hypothetical protein